MTSYTFFIPRYHPACLTLQRHLQNMVFYHKGLRVRKTPLPFVAYARKAAILRVQIWSAHESDVVGLKPSLNQAGGIRLTRDSWVSVMYAEALNSAKSSVTLQSTDRHGILGQKSADFQVSL